MYFVIEIQANKDGTAAGLITNHEKKEAESKYHEVLKYAAVSKVWKHSATLLADDGSLVKTDCYVHEDEGE